MRRWVLLVLKEEDDVATALADVPAGDADARIGGRIETLRLLAPVPLGHKVARRAIARGEAIRKYGAPIGEATQDIAAGAHVHVHNLRSLRARSRSQA